MTDGGRMRISGLAERTGVPVATLKYYLREGLLHAGTATARTQAVYDTTHVERVRLVRALTDSAGLNLGAVREVLAVLDDPPRTRHELLGAAQKVMLAREEGRRPPQADAEGEPPAPDLWVARVAGLATDRGWCDADDPLVPRLAGQLRAAEAAGITLTDAHLAALADAAAVVAAADVASVPAERAGAVRQVVAGTLLTDPVLLTLRRMAQQGASAAVEPAG
ncbi:MerR family transcriptional regulator [Isoptericola sp. F-RaC21]|uniref:MerR family transcriptional regulator n=1 Tax=Isoptericola sp. F-RaC21 TaxID=3141452 RepID=UPI00315BA6A8